MLRPEPTAGGPMLLFPPYKGDFISALFNCLFRD